MIKVGQIWEFTGSRKARKRMISSKKEIFGLTSPLTIVEIVAINKSQPGGITYHACAVLRDDSKLLDSALTDNDGNVIMIPDMFDEAIADGSWHLIMDSTATASKMGATCTKCKKDYPYANYVDDFKCWSCTNGF